MEKLNLYGGCEALTPKGSRAAETLREMGCGISPPCMVMMVMLFGLAPAVVMFFTELACGICVLYS